jgi:outer membrane protein assembly factor BamA
MRTRQLSVIFWVLLMVLQVSCAKKDQIIGDGRLIRHIRFEGADSLSKDLLLKHLFAGETSWVPFTPRYVYDEALTSVDTKRLVELYKSYGFFDASVISLEVLEPTKKKVDLVFKVHEGPRATVRNLHFEWIVDGESDFDGEHREKIEKHSALSPQGP